jgi:BTB/POZ domain
MEVKCVFKDHEWEGGQRLYTCFVNSASITEEGAKIISFKGNHVRGRRDEDVEAISFSDTTVECFPRDLIFFYPGLKAVEINNCGLKNITKKDLIGLENIEELTIDSNELTLLPDNLLSDMPKLKRISFYDNKLEFVNSEVLEPIINNHPTCINFQKNTKINMYYSADAIGSLKELMNELKKNYSRIVIDDDAEEPRKESPPQVKWSLESSTDFVIVAGSEEFRCHKSVIECCSQFVKISLNDTTINCIRIDESFEEAIKIFLRFAYTGKLENVSEKNVVKLIAFGYKFDVPEITLSCEEILLKGITEVTAEIVFNIGHQFGLPRAKQAAFAKIKEMFPEIQISPTFLDKPELLKKLIDGHLSRKRKIEKAQEEYNKKTKTAELEFESFKKNLEES